MSNQIARNDKNDRSSMVGQMAIMKQEMTEIIVHK